MKNLPTPIDPDEGIRRIKERDHTDARNGIGMTFEQEEALIAAIESGDLLCGLTDEGRLTFLRVD